MSFKNCFNNYNRENVLKCHFLHSSLTKIKTAPKNGAIA